MIKAKIIKNAQEVQFCLFDTLEAAQKWEADLAENKSWGKPAGFYPISQLSPEELAQEISRKEVDELGNPLMEVMVEIPAQYSVATEDITAQVEAEKAKEAQKKADRSNRVVNLKSIDWSKNLSNVELQAILKALVEDNLKDEV